MTNYNERIDELLLTTLREMSRELEAYGYLDSKNYLPEKREAITSLIKELVAEARIEYVSKTSRLYFQANSNGAKAHMNGYRLGIREYEQNLLKALEEL